VTVTGSGRPIMSVDLGAVPATAPLVLRKVTFPGRYVEENFTGSNRICESVRFSGSSASCR
jgi:hypothetical protein